MKSKRFAALFLAVMLVLTSLPFSVFAAENTGIEETGAEENTSSSITISDSSGDVPVVYAIDPYDEIKNRAEGGSNDMTQYGVTRDKIVSHLESHEHDDFYLGTPYQGGDWQSPNGDTSYNGSAGMNCTGFVSYVLRACGLNTGTFLEQLSLTGSTVWAGSGLPYDLMSGASNYLNAVQNGDIAAYTFRDKSELLASGLAQKGDIILMWWSLSPFDDGADNHIGFFWGDSPSEDKMWHSSTHPQSGNQISEIVPKTPGSYFILIKTENEEPTYSVTLTKTSADATVTQGNSAYSLAGATYNVYEGTTASGAVVATFTTDSSGHATINPPLQPGTYAVKETKAPPGYKLDPDTHVFIIDNADTTIAVVDDPGLMTIRIVKKDSQTGTTAQGNANLAGAVYRFSYQKGGQTVTQDITSSADGSFPILREIPFGTVTVQETSLQVIQEMSDKGSQAMTKRLVGEAKSLVAEEKPSAEAEEAPEQYAIEQIEGKAKKVGNIALDETKRAVEKSLKKEKQAVAEAVSSASPQEDRHVSEEAGLQLHEEKGPEVYEEELQNEVDKETSPSVIKEHGVQTHVEGEAPVEPTLGIAQLNPTPQGLSCPVPRSTGGVIHKLEEHPAAAYSQNIAAVSPTIHTLEGREEDSGQGANPIAAPQREPDSAVTVNGQALQTADRAVQSELYPEPEQSAYQFYPSIQAQQEDIPNQHTPSDEMPDRPTNPLEESGEARPRETTNQPGLSASQRESQFGQAPTQQAATQYKSFSYGGSPSSNTSNGGRKISKNGSGADDSPSGAPLRGQAPARAGGKASIKTREVSNEIHVSGKVSLNTWQRDFMVNQLNNHTPALATVSTQGGAAVQAVANYGQAAMLQAGGGMATAATGAATGGI